MKKPTNFDEFEAELLKNIDNIIDENDYPEGISEHIKNMVSQALNGEDIRGDKLILKMNEIGRIIKGEK